MKPFKTYRDAAKRLRSHSTGPTIVLIDAGPKSPQVSMEDRRMGRFFVPLLMMPIAELLEML